MSADDAEAHQFHTPAVEVEKDQDDFSLTPLGRALDSVIASLKAEEAMLKPKPIPKHVDCSDLLKHPAFRPISPGG